MIVPPFCIHEGRHFGERNDFGDEEEEITAAATAGHLWIFSVCFFSSVFGKFGLEFSGFTLALPCFWSVTTLDFSEAHYTLRRREKRDPHYGCLKTSYTLVTKIWRNQLWHLDAWTNHYTPHEDVDGTRLWRLSRLVCFLFSLISTTFSFINKEAPKAGS